MADAMISVIIPVFRTAEYLEKCVRSVMMQTYKNLEIILVDDGSDDECPSICDALANEDSRIKVIHKENGGLSSARNAGLREAKGEFIAFADSDDYLDENMYEKLMGCAENYDIVMCGYYSVGSNDKKEHISFPVKTEFSSKEALAELFNDDKIKNHVWNKLFKRKLFDNVQFPEGKTFEDIMTTYKLFEKSEKLIYIPYAGYYYVDRKGAISKKQDSETCFARYSAHLERYGDVKRRIPESRDVLFRQLFIQARAYLLSKPDSISRKAAVREFFASNEKPVYGSALFSLFEKAEVAVIVNLDIRALKLLEIFRKAEKLLKH